MKELNLLKPDLHSGYLNYGKGQEITYLEVPENIDLEGLRLDIENGATQYSELLAFAKKKPSKFVVINCNNKEEGLMAVSYLSAIYNRYDKLNPDEYDDDEVSDDPDIEFEDFEDDDPLGLNDEEEDWESETAWEENPWKIPVLRSGEISEGNPNHFDVMFNQGFGYNSTINPKNNLPYWYYTRKENICVVHYIYTGFFTGNGNELIRGLKRYKNNRHVFIVVVNEKDTLEPFCFDSDEETATPEQTMLCELILEYSAGAVNISDKEDELKTYYELLFTNWVTHYGFTLQTGFDSKRITKAITEINNDDKSALIEKVIKYVAKEERETTQLEEKDFEILSKFKMLGADLSKKEQKSAKKLEEELAGLDDVKEQIKSIVEVMRYNKRRKAMGLSSCNYHNVHMMIGAPGTAKTTVAELLGNMMAEEKLLKGNKFISINGAELKGKYVGHSAPKVKALFDEYDIIFIDEAYAVAAGRDGDIDSFSQEAIAQLIVELEKHGMDRLVMFAGYGGTKVSEKDNKMKAFLNANPGIRSRINSTIYFCSYTPEEMVNIFRCHVKLNNFLLERKADALVKSFFEERVTKSDFGNGREARSLLENTMVQAAKRLSSKNEDEITEKDMKELKTADVKAAIEVMKNGTMQQMGSCTQRCGFAC